MKIGVIGVGNIAKKAYLPITSRIINVDLVIYTRNKQTRIEIKDEYKHINLVESINDLLDEDLGAVMIHSTTESHYELCKLFLQRNIPVFVDKPVSLHIDEVEELFALAKKKNILFRVGFNSRDSPLVKHII